MLKIKSKMGAPKLTKTMLKIATFFASVLVEFFVKFWRPFWMYFSTYIDIITVF